MQMIGAGRTADIFDYGEGKILKLYKTFMPRQAVEQEYANSKYVFSLGIRVPEVFDLIKVDERWGIVFGKISGESMLRTISENPWTMTRESRQLGALHAALHGLDAASEMEKQVDVLSGHIRHTELLDDEKKEFILAYLKALPSGSRVCHGDFHPDNILHDGTDCWIIDWMTAVSGNPACDVARTLILLTVPDIPGKISVVMKSVLAFARKRIAASYLKTYTRISGIKKAEIKRWFLPLAAARLVEGNPEPETKKLLALIDSEIVKIKKTK